MRRRRDARAPAIWHGAAHKDARTAAKTVSHGSNRGVSFGWRWVSGALVVVMFGLLGLFFASDSFYVHTVAVGGLETLTKEEVFALTDIANYHLFWIDPETVQASLTESPTISEARVSIGWPPQMVQIVIQEREPVLVWEQAGAATWIDLRGRVMQLREDRANLIRVTHEGPADAPLALNDHIEPDVVNGALQIRELLPEIEQLRYSAENGLGFRDNRGWDAWFGTGTDMPNKLLIYNALVERLQARGIQPNVISVADPDAVYYSTVLGR